MLATFAVGGAAAYLNFPGVTLIPHGVDEDAWSNDPCNILCTDPNLNAGIHYLAENEGQFKETAAAVLNYCLHVGCDVIGSVLQDCVGAINNQNEFILAASAMGGAIARGMRP